MNFEVFAPAIQSILSQIVILIIGALGAAALYYTKLGVEYLKGKIGVAAYLKAKDFLVTLVKAYEQNPVFGNFDGAAKKEAVLARITQYCQANNIPITHEMLDAWIEEAVHDMNASVIEITGDEPKEAVPAG